MKMNSRNEMEAKEHILALKVMRLTRPTLSSPLVVTCDAKDLPGNLLNNDLKHDVTSVSGVETLAAGQFLLLPQSFGIIYLGETFSSYICVHNDSNHTATDVTVKVDLQTTSQRISLSGQHPQTRQELRPQETLDDVIHHEVKEVGTHILLCEVSYGSPQRSANQSFRKFFKFEVCKPLDVKTKFYNAESDEVYLEAQVQNITAGPICLEKVSLEASDLFSVTALNATASGSPVFGKVNVLQPQTSRQFLYCLSPRTGDLSRATTDVGKLDIVWRSNLGERGRLQTSQLQRMAPDYGDVRLAVQSLPNVVRLEEAFQVVCSLHNTCDKSMELVLGLESPASSSPGLVWNDISGRHLGRLEPGAALQLVLGLVPLAAGLQIISGIRLTDVLLKRTYEYDELAQVFVVH